VKFPPEFLAAYAGAVLFFISAWLVGRNEIRRWAGNLLLCVLTVFVVHFLSFAVTTERIGKTNHAVATDTGEMSLRLMSSFDSLRRRMNSKPSEMDQKAQRESLEQNESTLTQAVLANPKRIDYATKLIILVGELNPDKNKRRIEILTKQLVERGEPREEAHEVAQLLTHLYLHKEVAKDELAQFKRTLNTSVPDGWYREQATQRLLELTGDHAALKTFQTEVDDRRLSMLAKMVTLLVFALIAALIGIVTIFMQLGMISRSAQPKPDAVGLQMPLRTVLSVFVSWFSVQIVTSTGAMMILQRFPEIKTQPTMVALTTMLTYLISNLPALLLIYFLALKPRGLRFRDALKLRLHTSNSGPIANIFRGFLAWCSAIPLVLLSALAAHRFLGSQSSDNPVISQIIQTANASNPLAIILFYVTLGVIAPFFEEILFRGFLYGSLKPRIGAFGAMLASAAAFAALHLDKGGALMLFTIGFVLAYVFERSRSLVPAIIAHGLWNSGTFTLALILFSS
jgi:membrane protease YdiL (CAAX protease family)